MESEIPPLLAVLAAVVASAGVVIWLWIAGRLRGGRPILSPAPRRASPWRGVDVLMIVLVFLVIQIAAISATGADADKELADRSSEELARLQVALAGANLLAVGCAVGLLSWSSRATPEELGIPATGGDVAAALRIGAIGFLAATLPVYGLQMLMVQWQDYEHPVMTMLIERGDAQFWWVASLSAVFVAPLAEEFFFRLILQGWLEKQDRQNRPAPPVERNAAASNEAASELPDVEASGNPFQAPQTTGAAPSPDETPPGDTYIPHGTMPIVMSAALFALMHYGQGPAPVPLFVLGLILGYIYRQTHRLLPCIVLHMLFNAFSLLWLWLSLAGG